MVERTKRKRGRRGLWKGKKQDLEWIDSDYRILSLPKVKHKSTKRRNLWRSAHIKGAGRLDCFGSLWILYKVQSLQTGDILSSIKAHFSGVFRPWGCDNILAAPQRNCNFRHVRTQSLIFSGRRWLQAFPAVICGCCTGRWIKWESVKGNDWYISWLNVTRHCCVTTSTSGLSHRRKCGGSSCALRDRKAADPAMLMGAWWHILRVCGANISSDCHQWNHSFSKRWVSKPPTPKENNQTSYSLPAHLSEHRLRYTHLRSLEDSLQPGSSTEVYTCCTGFPPHWADIDTSPGPSDKEQKVEIENKKIKQILSFRSGKKHITLFFFLFKMEGSLFSFFWLYLFFQWWATFPCKTG